MEGEASPAARLLIADDHALVREGIRTMLAKEPDPEVVGEAENGREAIELCRSLRPDLVLMNVRMPQMDGLAATRTINLDATRAGAAGYVLKEGTKRQLVSAVRRVLDGESPLYQELAMRLLQHLSGEVQRHTRSNHPPSPPPTSVEKSRRQDR